MRIPFLLALALAGCSANPTDRVDWPVAVSPAAGRPERLVAVPPECGPVAATVHDLHGTSWHDPHLGLGCPTARNLALQVENPRDLLAGRAGTPDAEREARAVDRYRKGEEKDLTRTGTTTTFGGGTR
ncbi:MAG TPA: CpaD family pilus assembly lipoprotein [Azospirillum sp.]|nr:CpaD family pilus assembly lipoprotein [Azospirillum sp.]